MKHFRLEHSFGGSPVVEFRETPYAALRLVEGYLSLGAERVVIQYEEKQEVAPVESEDTGDEEEPHEPAS